MRLDRAAQAAPGQEIAADCSFLLRRRLQRCHDARIQAHAFRECLALPLNSEIILEPVCAGLEKARANGKRLGRPTVPASVEHSIRAARQAGKGQLAIARELGVGVSTVRRVLGAEAGA